MSSMHKRTSCWADSITRRATCLQGAIIFRYSRAHQNNNPNNTNCSWSSYCSRASIWSPSFHAWDCPGKWKTVVSSSCHKVDQECRCSTREDGEDTQMTDDDAQLKHVPSAILCGAWSIVQSSIGSSPNFAYTRDFWPCPFIISHCHASDARELCRYPHAFSLLLLSAHPPRITDYALIMFPPTHHMPWSIIHLPCHEFTCWITRPSISTHDFSWCTLFISQPGILIWPGGHFPV